MKILAIFVNPAVLLINVTIGIYTGIKKTYEDNLKTLENI